MYPSSFQPPPVPGGLPRHLERLRLALEALLARLRGSVADSVGRTAADALGEAVQAALGGTQTHASLPDPFLRRPFWPPLLRRA